MIADLINKYTVRINVNVQNWEEAIREGGRLLEDIGAIEQEYIEAMIQAVKDIGPYIVLAPGIAMPHANPIAGVKKLGMSLITLKSPIAFGNKENDPVSIVVCLAATRDEEHLQELSELVQVLGNKEKVKKIKDAATIQTVLDIFS